jgi:Rad3-related DNA helicase
VAGVTTGPMGCPLNSSFKNRENQVRSFYIHLIFVYSFVDFLSHLILKSYIDDLGSAVATICNIVPDGLLVFFPSYGVLNATITAWKCVSEERSEELEKTYF